MWVGLDSSRRAVYVVRFFSPDTAGSGSWVPRSGKPSPASHYRTSCRPFLSLTSIVPRPLTSTLSHTVASKTIGINHVVIIAIIIDAGIVIHIDIAIVIITIVTIITMNAAFQALPSLAYEITMYVLRHAWSDAYGSDLFLPALFLCLIFIVS